MTNIVKGQVVALFASDIGWEIDLPQLRSLTTTVSAQPISRKKQTPPYLQYLKPPQILSLESAPELFGSAGVIQATAFDFGAVSIAFRWPLADQTLLLDALPQLSRELYERGLEAQARVLVEQLLGKINPAVNRPELAELVEDYFLFIIEELDHEYSAEELLKKHGAILAQTLRLENTPLSPAQQADALSQSVSYYQNDLVLTDWNAAIIYDRDYEDTATVLELLNVELLEARYIDARLDTHISRYANLVRKRTVWPIPFRTPYLREIQELAELRIEASLLDERVDNALKLIGDLYLAKLHTAALSNAAYRSGNGALRINWKSFRSSINC